MTSPLVVALIGNPNTGKSTLFNALSGSRALTGNYPGVTVERKIGRTRIADRVVDIIDLPGTYSLAPRSLDEMVAVDVLLGRQPDTPRPQVVVCIVDASNLERNLYLVSQVREVGLPVVLVLNMADVAAERGVTFDPNLLSQRLGLPIVTTEAHRHRGLEGLRKAILQVADATHHSPPPPRMFPPEFLAECEALGDQLGEWNVPPLDPFLRQRLLLDVGGWLEIHTAPEHSTELQAWLQQARTRLAERGCPVPAVEARSRYRWIRETLQGVVTRPETSPRTFSDRLDRLLTHQVAGLFVFVVLMLLIFQAIYRGAAPLMEWCEAGQNWLAKLVGQWIAPGPLQSLVTDGIIGGVGSVLVFLPQIVILFLFIALLEDCGYMARAAFIMDKLMTRVGLSGKSFVPLMSSFACAVPGIMATRTIENRQDRFTTILVAPLMSCSARQPVYALLIGAFFPATYLIPNLLGVRELALFGMTSLGALVAIPIAWLIKKFFFPGETPPFVMELPSYKWPSPRLVFARVYDRARAFVVRAGTLIFMTNILVWAAGYFPGDHTRVNELQAQVEELEAEQETQNAAREQQAAFKQKAESILASGPTGRGMVLSQPELADSGRALAAAEQRLAEIEQQLAPLKAERNAESSRLLEQSLLGRLGRAIEPIVRPLGWDWRIGVGVLASFPAREVIVSTLGTIYSLGGEEEGLEEALRSATWPDGRPVYSIPVALSIMVFFALCAQCASTLMVIHRETNNWRWALFAFVYMTGLAYLGALLTYQLSRLWFG
ncbi:MAG: ferrous iron transport protein B [Planctomycetaceae bacterium]